MNIKIPLLDHSFSWCDWEPGQLLVYVGKELTVIRIPVLCECHRAINIHTTYFKLVLSGWL